MFWAAVCFVAALVRLGHVPKYAPLPPCGLRLAAHRPKRFFTFDWVETCCTRLASCHSECFFTFISNSHIICNLRLVRSRWLYRCFFVSAKASRERGSVLSLTKMVLSKFPCCPAGCALQPTIQNHFHIAFPKKCHLLHFFGIQNCR